MIQRMCAIFLDKGNMLTAFVKCKLQTLKLNGWGLFFVVCVYVVNVVLIWPLRFEFYGKGKKRRVYSWCSHWIFLLRTCILTEVFEGWMALLACADPKRKLLSDGRCLWLHPLFYDTLLYDIIKGCCMALNLDLIVFHAFCKYRVYIRILCAFNFVYFKVYDGSRPPRGHRSDSTTQKGKVPVSCANPKPISSYPGLRNKISNMVV